MPRKREQRLERFAQIWLDQHGREWETTYDQMGRGTTGVHTAYGNPGRHPRSQPEAPRGTPWRAPIYPPQPYMREDPQRPGRFEIDYNTWILELTQRHKEYDNERRHWANVFDKDANSSEVRLQAGAGPTPLDLVKACRAGNKWVLGLVPAEKVPTWAEPYRRYWEPEPPIELAYPDADDYGDAAELDDGSTPVDDEGEDDDAGEDPGISTGEIDRFGETEEAADPEATGGKRQPIRRRTHAPTPTEA